MSNDFKDFYGLSTSTINLLTRAKGRKSHCLILFSFLSSVLSAEAYHGTEYIFLCFGKNVGVQKA